MKIRTLLTSRCRHVHGHDHQFTPSGYVNTLKRIDWMIAFHRVEQPTTRHIQPTGWRQACDDAGQTKAIRASPAVTMSPYPIDRAKFRRHCGIDGPGARIVPATMRNA